MAATTNINTQQQQWTRLRASGTPVPLADTFNAVTRQAVAQGRFPVIAIYDWFMLSRLPPGDAVCAGVMPQLAADWFKTPEESARHMTSLGNGQMPAVSRPASAAGSLPASAAGGGATAAGASSAGATGSGGGQPTRIIDGGSFFHYIPSKRKGAAAGL